jgi:xylulokinase
VRAVFEGVAYNARWLLECVERFCRRRLEWLNMIGGGAQSDVWCQIYADVLNRRIRKVNDPLQANTRGAGLVGSVALGAMQFSAAASQVQIDKEFLPGSGNRKMYDELFREFVNLYRCNKNIFARLNKGQES